MRKPTNEAQAFFDCRLVAGLTDAEKKAAFTAAAPFSSRYVAKETVVAAGDPFSAIGIVADGALSIIRSGEHRRVIHKRAGYAEIFGVSSLFGGEGGFPTTVIAEETSTLLLLDEEGVSRMLMAVPPVAKNYITLLTEKIRFLNQRLDTLAGRSAEERVASFLLSRGGGETSLGITKSALASTLGLGRASLYRILDEMEQAGVIRTGRASIEVLDTLALTSFTKTERNEIK